MFGLGEVCIAPDFWRHCGVAAEEGREVALIFEADLSADFNQWQIWLGE